jgi:uncharacterized protein YdeI (YjbR/CyaY-like superfamily)
MTKSGANPKVDAFLRKATRWREETGKLRAIMLGCHLTEELKWNKPCYTFEGHNVVVMLPLKEYCALLFCKGALLKDANGILVKPGEQTQAARQIRFTNVRDIVKMQAILKGFIQEAIKAEKAGLKVTYKKITEYKIPEELQNKFDGIPALKTAFDALTPGRRRVYIMHFSAPKQSKTRESRIEKCAKQILNGKGLNER